MKRACSSESTCESSKLLSSLNRRFAVKRYKLLCSKSKCMVYDILRYIICMFMNRLCTDFHVVKLTRGVSVQIHIHIYICTKTQHFGNLI